MAMNIFEEIKANKRKTKFLIFLFVLFILMIGSIVGLIIFPQILTEQSNQVVGNFIFVNIIFLVVVVSYILWFYSKGDQFILKTTGAKPASRKDYPQIFHSVETLSIAAGLKKAPDCYVIKDTALNAYATGLSEEKSHIVLTTGIINKLNKLEIEGVIAHELAHIKNGDMKYMLICAGIVGVFQLLGTFFWYLSWTSNSKDDRMNLIYIGLWLLFTIIAPFFTLLLKLSISRNREYLADSTGAKFTRYPKGLASALKKISQDPDPLVDKANKATAHLFISTPFRNKTGFFTKLFSTHPPIQDRIKRLGGI